MHSAVEMETCRDSGQVVNNTNTECLPETSSNEFGMQVPKVRAHSMPKSSKQPFKLPSYPHKLFFHLDKANSK
jgi:hypothetical protein